MKAAHFWLGSLFLVTCGVFPARCFADSSSSKVAPCAAEGERIGARGMPQSCCPGLSAAGGWYGGYQGDCSLPPPPTGLSICTQCGDSICRSDTGENICNCPKDCKPKNER